jgi:hypothetical protein
VEKRLARDIRTWDLDVHGIGEAGAKKHEKEKESAVNKIR